MNSMSMSPAASPSIRRWWQEPYVWLVIGGPLVVVVAAIYTAIIAFEAPDPVIDRTASRPVSSVAGAEGQVVRPDVTDWAKLQPAHQARNHAASPVIPKAQTAESK
ncbi:MAG: hypothetical protein ACOVOX_07505 [Burkholderiaceae bacterium]